VEELPLSEGCCLSAGRAAEKKDGLHSAEKRALGIDFRLAEFL
jgi:hypothetical protein